MPQYYKDAFAKEHARIIGEGLGEFDHNLSISTETLDFDVLFIPNSEFLDRDERDLDLYYRLLKTDTVVNLEFFSGTLRPENLRECRTRTHLDWVKQKNNYDNLKKKIKASPDPEQSEQLRAKLIEPKLKFCWIIIALASTKTIESFQGKPHPEWGKGVYLFPAIERMGAIIIPELEKRQDTLWLRTLGKENVLKEAFLETIDLPLAHPKRNAILDLGRSYFSFLSEIEIQLSDEEVIDMKTLREIYQANRAETIALHESLAQAQLELHRAKVQATQSEAEGRAEGHVESVKNFLVRRFGDEVLTAEVAARLGQMSPEDLDDLLFEAASWQSASQVESYFDRGSV
jgi:hypothetical protein